ncbi:fms-related tyrosine kinase 3 ligand [Vidua chalybeata]|uniref:fms-related tyrosine kinase 3 ligand n=1 Tax=Vidua chalybeata TaxID=81927 RepID=UPI0023A8B29E|nr:fms-related tyrosine kinase 3 ligand [Vidua chalybeata]
MDLPPPRSALVPLLLLLAVPTPSSCCSFGFNPISSTFSAHLNNLTPWLLLDYPVAMPSNLEPVSENPPNPTCAPPNPSLFLQPRTPLTPVPPNPQLPRPPQDSACSDLWGLHFGALALQRMLGVAGKDLAPLLRTLLAQLHFVAECHIQDPRGCVQLEMVNVSQLLETLVQHLGGLQGRPPHFPGCARLRCHPGWDLSGRVVLGDRHRLA